LNENEAQQQNSDTNLDDVIEDDYGNQEKAVGKNGKNSGADDSKRENNAILPENSVVELENHMTENESLETQSQFFSYFVFFTILCLVAYLVVHNKKKILALVMEGRRKNTSGRASGGRRSSSAQYRKLDNNLEEAMGSTSDESIRHVIY
jgi:hypothetical protein